MVLLSASRPELHVFFSFLNLPLSHVIHATFFYAVDLLFFNF